MAPEPTTTHSRRRFRLRTPAILAFAAGLLPVALVAAALLYSPGCPPVELTREELRIDSRFYGMTAPRTGVDTERVRVVDLDAEAEWKPVARTGGFGNRYYRAGNFRAANGRTVKLYTTGARRLVLLPPADREGMPILLEVPDPNAFVARVRKAWAAPDTAKIVNK